MILCTRCCQFTTLDEATTNQDVAERGIVYAFCPTCEANYQAWLAEKYPVEEVA